METRKQLVAKTKANLKMIEKLNAENLEFLRKSYLLCDKRQQFIEEVVTVGRGKNKREELQGRINWMQIFVDEDTGEEFKIQRTRVVRINGEWI